MSNIYKFFSQPLGWDIEPEDYEELYFTTKPKLMQYVKDHFKSFTDDKKVLKEFLTEFKKDGNIAIDSESYYSWKKCKVVEWNKYEEPSVTLARVER